MALDHESYKTLFIDEATLKANAVIDGNVDPQTLIPTIRTCQELQLQPLLSTPLYSDLQTKIKEESLSDKEKFLLDMYIRPCLIWYVTAEYYLLSTFRQKNAGVGRQSAEDFQPAELNEIQYLKGNAEQKAEWYGQRLIDYLKANKTDFEKYKDGCDVGKDDVPAAKTAFRNRIYLG